MLRQEEFMDIQKLHHDGLSVSEIGRQLDMDRKTVRKYLSQAPRSYKRKLKSWKVDSFRAYLRERWELGVHNAVRLFKEIQKCGYARLRDAGEEGGAAVAEPGPGAGVRAIRNGAPANRRRWTGDTSATTVASARTGLR